MDLNIHPSHKAAHYQYDQNIVNIMEQSHNNKSIRVSSMIEQQAIIIANEARYAWVMADTQASCESCTGASGGCSTLSLASLFRPKNPPAVKVLNPTYAKVGERVVIGIKSDAFLVYSVLAYALPLIGMLVFAIIGTSIFGRLGLNTDLGAMLAGVGGLLLGFGLARHLSHWSQHLDQFQPVILRKLWDVKSIQLPLASLQ